MVEDKSKDKQRFFGYNESTDRFSYKKKIQNNYEWARHKIDLYSGYTDHYSEKREKYKINYDLYNGRFDFNSINIIQDELTDALNVEVDSLELDGNDYIHFPILQTILNDLVGEEIKRPFNLRVVSTDSNSESVRQRKTKELLVENVGKSVRQDQIQKLRIQNQDKLTQLREQIDPNIDPNYIQKLEEIDRNFENQIHEMADKLTPLEVETYMSKGFRLPEEKLMDEILQYHKKTDRIKLVFDRGWEDVVVTGEEIYWTGEENGKPVIRRINPLFFNCSKNPNKIFYDEMDWSTYDEYLTLYEIYQRFGNDFKEKERKVLDKYEKFSNRFKDGNAPHEVIPNAILDIQQDMDYYTPDLLNDLHGVENDKRIRVTHVVWKTLKKIKYIFRLNDAGELDRHIVDETYIFDKSVDVKQEILYVPEFWEGYKIHTEPKIYLKMGPIPNQYRDIDNPFQIRGPYTGGVFSSNNSKPVAIADLGKPWQFLYDVVVNQIIELLKTDIGKVLLGLSEQIPKNMKPVQWMSYIKKFKVALISATKDGDLRSMGIDPQYWKSIDLSTTQEISGKIQLLEYIEKKMALSMSYNPNRLGQQSPYETVSNNQQNIIQSSNQTERWFYLHNYIKERATENYIEICKEIYKTNPLKASYVLSDLSIATLNTEVGDFANYNYKVYITNTLRDTEKLNQLKNLIQPIIQNSNGDLRIAAEIIESENANEIRNIIHRIQEQKEAREQQLQEQNNRMQMQMAQMEQQDNLAERQLKKQIADDKNKTTLEAANLNADRFKRANDIDENKVNDFIDLEEEKQKFVQNDPLYKKKLEKIELENKNLEKKLKEDNKK